MGTLAGRLPSRTVRCALIMLATSASAVTLLAHANRLKADDPPRTSALLVGGESFAGALVGSDEVGRLVFSAPEGSRIVALADLVRWGHPREPRSGSIVLLAGGGWLLAEVDSADQEAIRLQSETFGELSLPLGWVAAVILISPADWRLRDALIDRLGGVPPTARHIAGQPDTVDGPTRAAPATPAEQSDLTLEGDQVHLANGDTLSGTVSAWSATEITLEVEGRPTTIELGKIAAVAFDPSLADAPPAAGDRTWLGFADGSRLVASIVNPREDAVVLQVRLGHALRCSLDDLVCMQPLGSRVRYLSDVAADSYRYVPLLSLSWPYRTDRSVTDTWLRARRDVYIKGIGMHSPARLTYKIADGEKRFAASVALDDQTGGRGSVVFRVFVDGNERFKSPLVTGGMAPLAVEVDVSGGRLVSLLVDYADRGDELDRADWLDARLEK